MPTYKGQPYQPSGTFLDLLIKIKSHSVSVAHFNMQISQLELTKKQRTQLGEFYECVLNELPWAT